jgi:hypothetical protein
VNGNEKLTKAIKKLNIDLACLVAETAIWADPSVCEDLLKKNGTVVWFPGYRRGKNKERKGDVIDGIKIDDNTYANNAIKYACGIKRNDIENYNACHIWPNTCYDERFHTAIPNLVLIPNAIAGLSDFSDDVMKALQYHSYELYNWYPQGHQKPIKPLNYPTNWQRPTMSQASTRITRIKKNNGNVAYNTDKTILEVNKVQQKIPEWFKNQNQTNSKILINFIRLQEKNGCVSYSDLEKDCQSIKNFKSNFDQMKNFGKKNHAKVFDMTGTNVQLWEQVSDFIVSEYTKTIKSTIIPTV